MNDDQYLTQTQIGKRYGNMSAKKVGQWLKEGRPTQPGWFADKESH